MPIRLLFGDFELDEARFDLRKNGQQVAVQPKVLDLILHLARHRDRVVTKEELFERVWEGVAVSEASLSQAVSLARRALDDTSVAQHTIRTARGRGMQFVAECRGADAIAYHVPGGKSPPPGRTRAAPAELGSTALETAQAVVVSASTAQEVPHLFAAIHCETPIAGGASWSLADVDEVLVGRGSERRVERSSCSMAQLLTLSFPGRLMSRHHARIIRTPAEWLIVDLGSRNGTFVNGERVDKTTLASGDIIECGRTLLWFTSEPVVAGTAADTDSFDLAQHILPTVTPRVAALARDLVRLATSDVPILLSGESGVGKTHVAHALHGISRRPGPLVTFDAATLGEGGVGAMSSALTFSRAQHGTLLLENIDQIPEPMFASSTNAIDGAPAIRLLCTSTRALQEIDQRLPADLLMRLSGFHCALPPLRERRGDLGVHIASLLDSHGRASLELDAAAGLALLRHSWPGNLRELARTIQIAATLADGKLIGVEHLLPHLRARTSA